MKYHISFFFFFLTNSLGGLSAGYKIMFNDSLESCQIVNVVAHYRNDLKGRLATLFEFYLAVVELS